MDLFRWNIQRFGHCRSHHRQPFGKRLFSRVFGNDQMSGIPVYGSAYFRDIPVVKSEHFDVLSGVTLVKVLEPFLCLVRKHLRLISIFFR
jgi:hypothetical protein